MIINLIKKKSIVALIFFIVFIVCSLFFFVMYLSKQAEVNVKNDMLKKITIENIELKKRIRNLMKEILSYRKE